jgi:hypothetical protein
VSVYVSLRQLMSVYVSLGQFRSVYISLSQFMSIYVSLHQFISVYVSLLQFTSVYVSVCQFTSVYASLHQFMSVYISLRQFTSVYISLCQCMSAYSGLALLPDSLLAVYSQLLAHAFSLLTYRKTNCTKSGLSHNSRISVSSFVLSLLFYPCFYVRPVESQNVLYFEVIILIILKHRHQNTL